MNRELLANAAVQIAHNALELECGFWNCLNFPICYTDHVGAERVKITIDSEGLTRRNITLAIAVSSETQSAECCERVRITIENTVRSELAVESANSQTVDLDAIYGERPRYELVDWERIPTAIRSGLSSQSGEVRAFCANVLGKCEKRK